MSVETSESPPELTIVMPCLNEADTLEVCLEKAQRALRDHAIRGEIIVADNGSSDGSQDIATRMGARVVPVSAKGYGNALKGGIAAARGKFIIMGDADDSYDFLEVPKFVEKLREGAAIAQGCRLPAGGGQVLPNAMPFLHRWWGNPMFTFRCAGCSTRPSTTFTAVSAASPARITTAWTCALLAWNSPPK